MLLQLVGMIAEGDPTTLYPTCRERPLCEASTSEVNEQPCQCSKYNTCTDDWGHNWSQSFTDLLLSIR